MEDDKKKGNSEAEIEEGYADETESEPVIEPRVFIVGLGQTGRRLIYRIMNSVPVVGLDMDEKKVELAEKRMGDSAVKIYAKDGTSRITWEELGLSEKDLVVCTTRRDNVNMEACRIARKHFGTKRLLSLMHTTSLMDEYAEIGVEVVNRAHVLASFFESRVLGDRRMATSIGLGQGEIMEIPILPGSAVAGRPLSSFRARPWLVGAIYRDDHLIVPHGHTVIEEGDRVVLVGEPHILAGIADFFKVGEPQFPLQYGPRIGILHYKARGERYDTLLNEAKHLTDNTNAVSLVLLSVPGSPEPDVSEAENICGHAGFTCEPAYLPDEEHTPWPRQLQTRDFGCLVLDIGRLHFLKRVGFRRSFLRRLLEESTFPILISRGTHPYERILVPVALKSSPFRVAELAINLSRLFSARLDAVTVTEPAFAAGQEAVEKQKQILDRIVEQSAVYRHSINIVHREGNPIMEIVDQASESDLVVMGYHRRGRTFIPRLHVALEILVRLSCSVMILPYTGDEQ
jgi:Trk K+ transport system NAD-binding subunit/nucleotide-binding universal stress UspA family protein